jgi:hypothetical protein
VRQRRLAAGDDALDQVRLHVERRRTFSGIQDAQTAAGPCPDIEKAPAGSHSIHDPIDGFSNLGNLGRYRARHLLIFLINDGEDIGRSESVDMSGSRIRLLGQESFQVHFRRFT